MITRTMMARCDREVEGEQCPQAFVIQEDHTQPWRLLTKNGWSLDHTNDKGILTVCPAHTADERNLR